MTATMTGAAGAGPDEGIRGRNNLCCGARLKELGFLSLKKRRLQGDLKAPPNTLRSLLTRELVRGFP